MKKYLIGIVTSIIIVGFSGFSVIKQKANISTNQTYVWHKYNAAGTAELSPVVTFTGTAAGAKTTFGCPDGDAVNCARAYNMNGTATSIFVKKSPQ